MNWYEKKKLEYEKKFLELIKKNKIDHNLYQIPVYLKKAEAKFLQKDRDLIYKRVNNRFNKDFGELMQELYEKDSDKYYIGIHRTAKSPDEVFKKGIWSRGTSIHDHVQIIKNFPFLLQQLSVANNYKFSLGSFIVKIPKKDIDKNFETDEIREPIFYQIDDEIRLKPEYIVGYVPVNDGNLNEFIPNNFPTKEYSENTEFLYDESIEKLIIDKNSKQISNAFTSR